MSDVNFVPEETHINVLWGTDTTFTADLTENNEAVDITGDSVEFVLRRSISDDPPLLVLRNDSGQHSNPQLGETDFTVTAQNLIDAGAVRTEDTTFRYAITRRTSAGAVKTHILGRFKVEANYAEPVAP